MFLFKRSLITRVLLTTVIITASAIIFVYFSTSSQHPASYQTAMLMRAVNDTRVYYVADGKRHWITSAETFKTQGFSWDSIRVIPQEELSALPEGDSITQNSRVIMEGEATLLPDLISFPAEELRLEVKNDRRILRFTSTFLNQGGGSLEIVADPTLQATKDTFTDVFQRIKNEQGTEERLKSVGYFMWHAIHGHYHLNDVMSYNLEALEGSAVKPSFKDKVSVCLRDDRTVNLSLNGAPQSKGFSVCDGRRQGVSVGWADVYRYTLPDQYLDVHDLPAGTYNFWFDVNPKRQILEQRIDNNQSVVVLMIDPAQNKLEIIGKAAPLLGTFSFPEGTVIHAADTDGAYYVIHNNKKRILSDNKISLYGTGAGKTIERLPQGMIDAIPFNNLVKSDGQTIYALNDSGYKRPFPTLEAFASYGFASTDVATIAADELSLYPDANYIKRSGDDTVYAIERGMKQIVTDITNIPTETIHVINDADFNAYVLK
ncbi:MAG: hypothetical protein A3A80_00700 [Candidatus Terrybacteria bacterium RIFCSPLOWO2_01_FULL_44_24]|uniref:Uncharacterized protein n=1 Tax=Candidatus Terrybacteria bacterium RIFCSPHIGHO2_01_FULL_43_35 TaxID=1802361 RepID=A0A1G2PEE9_9BACT|nr:MAG: hypothetical protein A2828_02705 [Candidatus Terrybacteria bacterium RIFCSPHIGHO2_01_FULL_43_35]OHA49510.1 MAG: hypothetical protein A3B75_00030 [Candidatus Terrybacteria bacterium RIFCSPHIGHO2_02_FULL_43_14]OHA51444.1 MAG: hypothetical protein A3A80_00700 [Candidatus Terrybacteria bacterium RIFCSPLOWO2_01_FULL_44_24]